MSDIQLTINDMVNAVTKESPSDFQTAFADVMLTKMNDAIELKKVEFAQNYFNYEAPPVSVEPDNSIEITAEVDQAEQEEPADENTETVTGTQEA